ncbi:MAG: hypothetical protein WBD28_06455 [Candidatus Zixiibacteriota bacterium]
MQKKMTYVLIFVIVLLLGASTVLWSDSTFCPIQPAGDKDAVDLPQKRISGTGKAYSVPRNQVLVEMATATW